MAGAAGGGWLRISSQVMVILLDFLLKGLEVYFRKDNSKCSASKLCPNVPDRTVNVLEVCVY